MIQQKLTGGGGQFEQAESRKFLGRSKCTRQENMIIEIKVVGMRVFGLDSVSSE
jgi:hypothetical protein